MITKRSISKPDSSKKEEPGEIAIKQTMIQNSSHCSRPLSSSQTTTHPDKTRPAAHRPTASRQGHPENRTRPNVAGGGPGTQKHIHTTPRRPPREPAKPTISSTPARPHANRGTSPTHGPHDGRQTIVLKNSVERR